MINTDAEINRLRSYLSQRGWMPNEIDEICDLAARDVNEVILDVISNAVAQATDYAIDLGAEEFLEDLDVVEIGGGYMIGTISGKTDYSIPERKMLPDLVKGGKTAEDGSKYRVIPVGNTKTIQQPRDIFTHLRQRASILEEARRTLNQQSLDNRSARAQKIAGEWRNIISRKMNERLASVKPKENTIVKQPEFRTASENQDENTQWVIPAKEMDMTGYLMDLNKRIQESIYSATMYIVDSYEKEFT